MSLSGLRPISSPRTVIDDFPMGLAKRSLEFA
jgi:hypothetical protein